MDWYMHVFVYLSMSICSRYLLIQLFWFIQIIYLLIDFRLLWMYVFIILIVYPLYLCILHTIQPFVYVLHFIVVTWFIYHCLIYRIYIWSIHSYVYNLMSIHCFDWNYRCSIYGTMQSDDQLRCRSKTDLHYKHVTYPYKYIFIHSCYAYLYNTLKYINHMNTYEA